MRAVPGGLGVQTCLKTFTVAITALVLAAGCEKQKKVDAACLPPGVVEAAAPLPAAQLDRLRVYLDVSTSSANYGLADGKARPYRDLIAWIVKSAGDKDSLELVGFADNIVHGQDANVFNTAATGPLRNASGAITGDLCNGCGRNQSKIDKVLEELAADASAPTSLILTDLWLVNEAEYASEWARYRDATRKLFNRGLAIGVFAFEAPYAAAVFDLPDKVTIAPGKVKSRPYFILIVGQPAEVAGWRQRIQREAFGAEAGTQANFALFSPYLAMGGHQSLTFTPVAPGEGGQPYAERPSRAQVNVDNLPIFEVDRVETLNAAGATDSDGEKTAGFIGLTAPVSEGWAGDAGPKATYTVEAKAWKATVSQLTDLCIGGAWQPFQLNEAVKLVPGGDGATVGIDLASPVVQQIDGRTWSAVTVEVRASSIDESSPAWAWLDAWSLDESLWPDMHQRAAYPDFFPTRGIAVFRDALVSALEDSLSDTLVARGSLLIAGK